MIISHGLTYQPSVLPPAAAQQALAPELSPAQQVLASPHNTQAQNEQKERASRQGANPNGVRKDPKEVQKEQRLQGKERELQNKERLLSEEEQRQLDELKQRDQEVRQHEQAHASAGNQFSGAPRYEFTRGPDGRLYATGGEVAVDTSPVPNDPEETIRKAEIILKAALAPGQPSDQDRRIAAEAQRMLSEARAELARQRELERRQEQEQGKTVRQDEAKEQAARLESQRQTSESVQRPTLERDEAAEKKIATNNSEALRLQQINEQLSEVNRRLVDLGVFSKLYPSGVFVNVHA